MSIMIRLLPVGIICLIGCNSQPRQSASQPHAVASPISKPITTPTPKPKSFIKLHPKFKFVVKKLKIESSNSYGKSKWEAIDFVALLSYKGPKPDWWGRWPQFHALTFITDKGKKYQAFKPKRGHDQFNRNTGHYVLCTDPFVPNLKQSDKIVKAIAVFEIEKTGLTQISVNVTSKN